MLSYRRFIERVEFYEGYIGEEEVTKRLNRSLGGFHRGDIKEIKKVIEIFRRISWKSRDCSEYNVKKFSSFFPVKW